MWPKMFYVIIGGDINDTPQSYNYESAKNDKKNLKKCTNYF